MATVKLLWFAVERAADPIAASLERVAVRSPGFSKFCVSVARRYNALTSTHRVSLFADEPLAAKEPLSERAATKIGAELLAEAVGASRVRSHALARSRTLSPASQTVVTLAWACSTTSTGASPRRRTSSRRASRRSRRRSRRGGRTKPRSYD